MSDAPKWLKIVSALNLGLAVGLGAFGAHGLEPVVGEGAMEWFKTGHSYHMWHGLGLLMLLVLPISAQAKHRLGILNLVGTFFFAGSLYLMTVTGIRWLGAITPIGGVTWIAGWVALAVALGKSGKENS